MTFNIGRWTLFPGIHAGPNRLLLDSLRGDKVPPSIRDSILVKCLFCKYSAVLAEGETLQDYLEACEHRCKACGQEGLMRDVVGEAKAKKEGEKEKTCQIKEEERGRFMYPVPLHVFLAEGGCPSCGGTGARDRIDMPCVKSKFPNGRVVGCMSCTTIYEWPCVDIRELDSPGEKKPLSPKDEEARLRRITDNNLREVFG